MNRDKKRYYALSAIVGLSMIDFQYDQQQKTVLDAYSSPTVERFTYFNSYF